MMKSNALLRGSGAGLAAIIKVDTQVGFLTDRKEAIDLSPVAPSQNGGYVWKRIFLKGKRHKD